jgi:glyoxylase-like metal-dependent hydrolase (beta-lactamase superfamily II)
MIRVVALTVGTMGTNCYLIWDEETMDGIVVDPGDEGDYISEKILEYGISLQGIVLTHGHFDHVLGVLSVKLNFMAPIHLHKKDEFLYKKAGDSAAHWQGDPGDPLPPIDDYIEEGNEIYLGKHTFKVMETPGHTPGSIVLLNEEDGLVFSGDTMFKNGVGRTDFKYSSFTELQESLDKLNKLPGKWLVYPGHGEETGIFN